MGFICARALPHFGAWNNFSPAIISKLRDEVEQPRPSPKASDHTIMNSSWIVPVPSNSSDPTRLSMSEIKKELDQREMKDTHMAISDEVNDKITVESKKKGVKKDQIQQENFENKNYFYVGWALKENQEYGKKGANV
ncbi:hypothetical protein C2G38_2315287 [Gigaspora rosea]|uniref:Uncharacterized protein n=1 Tax=Gigaspora rosea TaxID=44941 RepID=A0A397V3B6_9GLOM|nr:hypothetical protein C2G38_2315287 [Gigaspora rosea]